MTDHGDHATGVKGFLQRHAVDIRPLREVPAFRRLWISEVVTNIGAMITGPAVLIQVAAITHSAFAAGLIGAAQLIPLMLGTILGGPIIDRVDRRKLLLISEAMLALTSIVLLLASFSDRPPLWVLYLMVAASSFFWGVDLPTRSAMTPNIVGENLIAAAVALNFLMWSISGIFGPMLAGISIAVAGLPLAYGVDVLTSVLAIALLLGIPPQPVRSAKPRGPEDPPVTWTAIKEGFLYLKGRRVLQSTFTIDLAAMIFGLPAALFPILAVTQFHRSIASAAVMFTFISIGELIATVTNGWVHRVRHQGQAVVFMVILWGAAITAFGLIGSHFYMALFFLAVAGGADATSAIFRSTILQSTVPDELRGRLSSFHFMVVAGGPKLGYFESGAVAALFNPFVAVVSGGVACIVGAVVNAALVPEFWRYHAGDDTMTAEEPSG